MRHEILEYIRQNNFKKYKEKVQNISDINAVCSFLEYFSLNNISAKFKREMLLQGDYIYENRGY